VVFTYFTFLLQSNVLYGFGYRRFVRKYFRVVFVEGKRGQLFPNLWLWFTGGLVKMYV